MKTYILLHMTALGAGILLDLLIGDPHWFPHPIRLIGKYISFLEMKLFPEKGRGTHRDPGFERKRGLMLWLAVFITVTAAVCVIIVTAYRLHPWAGAAVEAGLTCCILAAGSLSAESRKVEDELDRGNIPAARKALSMIVGRDTEELGEEGIIKAAVETVAENTSDGVIAPLLFTAAGGPVLGFGYKAVNTMDSMLGYHNDRYEHFGKWPARVDDAFNFIPARISAVLMILSAFLLGLVSKEYSGRDAYRIWKRDRRNHLSPNSAQTESVCGGALGLKLGGSHYYGGVLVEKPEIGDERRKPVPEDVSRAGRLMFGAELLAAAAVGLMGAGLLFLI